ncbi:MAG TPA: hypothetical protein VN754_05640 [Candidatus Binataceae bacterium]|nr:hypothetical protein [Candidatus Binataceae bacterium]
MSRINSSPVGLLSLRSAMMRQWILWNILQFVLLEELSNPHPALFHNEMSKFSDYVLANSSVIMSALGGLCLGQVHKSTGGIFWRRLGELGFWAELK